LPIRPARAARSVPLARGAEAAEQIDLQRRGLGQLVRRQLGAALIEVVGDPHRADGVGRRGPGTDLVEFLDRGHHRALGLLDHVEVGIQGGRRAAAGRARRLGGDVGDVLGLAAGQGADRQRQGAAHHEGAAIGSRRRFTRVEFGDDRPFRHPVHRLALFWSGARRRPRPFVSCDGSVRPSSRPGH
jgi:hypothetical protein